MFFQLKEQIIQNKILIFASLVVIIAVGSYVFFQKPSSPLPEEVPAPKEEKLSEEKLFERRQKNYQEWLAQEKKEVAELRGETEGLTRGVMDAYFLSQQAASPEEKVQAFSAIKQAIPRRKDFMVQLAKRDPESFLRNALPPEVREALPADFAKDIETKKVIEGSLLILHTDYFEELRSETSYDVRTPEGDVSIFTPQELPPLLSSTEIKAEGVGIADVLVVPYPDKQLEIK